MKSHYPLAAKRLYALMGDKMLDFPPHFIERLERRLEAFETSRSNKHVVVPLRLISDIDCEAAATAEDSPAEPQRAALIAVPVRTLQALASIFEILHAVHLGKQDVQSEGCVTSLMVEGLILSGRDLVRSSADAMWSQQ
ncbi:hypothetical protein [Stenotrophomonas sp. SORGH_AS_0321]|uniref:hypothetical protein n=1 Tax=Stenotrophomonas sp. SORGH_AS_0321 TaxID=3041787 RepID=UPI002865A42A|nr:hypothetical protein [Stenotrophomonas sp. SORGH_AS_0321]MDR6093526.1 hypothetical protein [Stenotrophomonas sp. SORGH_AS_0321]